MSRKVLGVDIRSKTLSAVLVKSSLRESRIAGFMSAPIPATENGAGGLRSALEAIASGMNLGGADCVVSIPAVLFSCRNLQVPFQNQKKIRMMLPYEIEPHLPYPADELAIDFSVLNGQTQDQTEILAVAIEKTRLSGFLEDLAALKLDPERITVSGLPAALLLGRNSEPNRAVLFLDIGETSGALFIVAGEHMRMMRSFPLPADPASRARTVRTHIRTTLAGWRDAVGLVEPPEQGVLTGDGVGSLDLEELTGVLPLEKADLGQMLNLSTEAGVHGSWDPLRMDGALALALAEIEGIEGLNFHRGQFLGRKVVARYGQNLAKTGALAAAVLVLMFASFLAQGYLVKNRLEDLDRQIAAIFSETFPEVKKVVDPYQQMQINLQELKKSAGIPGETLSTVRSIDLLKNISDIIPAEISVVVDRLVLGPDTILLSGSTGAFNAVDEIKGHLERKAMFKKVTISSANTDRSGKEVNFQLKVDL